MKAFVSYTYDEIVSYGDGASNIIFEMVASCLAYGTRIIIERGKRGSDYIMVDFNPTDGSNSEFPCDDSNIRVTVTSVMGNNEGLYNEEFCNYADAINWLCEFLMYYEYTEVYTETY